MFAENIGKVSGGVSNCFELKQFRSVVFGENLGRASGGVSDFLELKKFRSVIFGENLGRASGGVCIIVGGFGKWVSGLKWLLI